LVEGRTVRGKAIYINRKEQLPLTPRQPLTGGGKGGMSIRIMLTQPPPGIGEAAAAADGPTSEAQILLYVHEFFHALQSALRPEGLNDAKSDRNFTVDLSYAKWSSVEGRALMAALEAPTGREARERLKDYLVARRIKQRSMPAGAVAFENVTALLEGTALYSNTKMPTLVRDARYAGTGHHEGDAYFFGFSKMDAYVKQQLTSQMTFTMDATLDTLVKYYNFGAYECFALDRVAPGWKKGFFQSGKTLDQAVAEALRLSPREEERVARRLADRYGLPSIEAKHQKVIQERDDAIALVESRKGRRYVVDFAKTKEFFDSEARGSSVRLGVREIFPHGVERVSLGEVEMVGADTPMERPWIWTMQWIDTEAVAGDRGYEVAFESRDGEVLKGVTLKTKGFTLKAPEVTIAEDQAKDQVVVTILSKVRR
jgi:hypothetical protein